MLPFGDFMKSKFFTSLLLATAISSGFADVSPVSTLAQRNAMVTEALSKGSEDALKAINEAQQNGQIKTDDQNYVVAIKIVEPGKKYERAAHSKKEKLEEKSRVIESSLEETVKQAEKDLANTSGPIPFNFSVNGKTLYAMLFKKDAYMIFNICEKKDEMDALLKPADKPIEKPAETTPVAASPVVTAEKSVEAPAVAPDAKPADAVAKTDEKAAVTTPASDAKPADAVAKTDEKSAVTTPAPDAKPTDAVKVEPGKAEATGPVAAAAA